MKRLENKIALVTGGASGIGKAIVERFIQEGAKVVFTDLNENLGKTLQTEMGVNSFLLRPTLLYLQIMKTLSTKL